MPQKEFYGAQPPIELIRQWMDHKGWYNRKELVFNEVIDIVWCSAIGPPGGGRTVTTDRLRRHYNTIVAADLSVDSMETIFQTILGYFLENFEEPLIKKLTKPIVKEAIGMFNDINATLLPTPKKSHYMFNLRDIWKVFQTMCVLSPKKVPDPLTVVKCWVHENFRVFGDRLTNGDDRDWLKSKLIEKLANIDAKKYTEATIFDCDRLIFGDFMVPGADPKYYVEIKDMGKMKSVMESYLEDFNNVNTITMPLVMFLDACEHVARISRVIAMPQGNCLLLGGWFRSPESHQIGDFCL
jgi:dynein heavy chain